MSTATAASPTVATTVVAIKPRRRRKRVKPASIAIAVGIAVLLVFELYPLVWLFLSSFKTQNEFTTESIWSLPASFDWANYGTAITTGNLGQYALNSVLTVFPALALLTILGVAGAFALEVMVWKGRGGVLLFFLAGIMVPAQMILLPLFNVYFRTGLSGTLWPLIITYTALGLPLTVFLLATFFRAVPREIFEAATIDGASIYRLFFSIGVPMIRNAIATVLLVQFFFLWNDLLIAYIFTTKASLRTIQVGLLAFNGQYGSVQWGPLFAAICINVFGTLLIYLALNQQIMKGLAAGSVKG
jgi:raffinose/stachyose/melibiose transport system permease protein